MHIREAASETVRPTGGSDSLRPLRPAWYSSSELARAGVEIADHAALWYRCRQCGRAWRPGIEAGGRMPENYWHCPQGCNLPHWMHTSVA